ncbi:MAG TPA: OmpA family protein [Flavisolibacter sp.]|nr:OmpA family protein [Flavisolibacter sp.]
MRYLLIILLVQALPAAAQNLLLNGDFEEENICSEYKVNCAPEAWLYTVPSLIYYYFDEKGAYNGKHYVSFLAGHSKKPFYRTFVRNRLLCGLHKGNTYQLQFYIKSLHPILDSLGVYFTDYDFLMEKKVYQKIVPSLYLADAIKKPVKGDTGWQQITFNFTATGQEAYIAFGNFKKSDVPNTTGIQKENNFYVHLDGVSLVPLNKNEVRCKDWQKNKAEIYSMDDRHEYQVRYMRSNRINPPRIIYTAGTILDVDTLLVPDVLFATNSFTITRNAQALLDSFARRISQHAIDSIIVYGHTDSRGTDDVNKELSWRRANTVGSYLDRSSPVKTISRGAGSERPIASNRTPEGRQQNRRVEILVYKRN